MSGLLCRRRVVCAGLIAALASCAETPMQAKEWARGAVTPDDTVYVVRHGWHAGLVIERAALLAIGVLPEAGDFPGSPFLEFGWGDRAYYMSPDPTAWLTLRAAFAPTPAVLHVSPLAHPLAGTSLDAISVELSKRGFAGLVQAVADTFERRSNGPQGPIASGLSPGARFYAARGTFHLFNTCNTWVASMLAAGGVPIDPTGIATADDLMRRVRSALPRQAA